MSSPPRFSLRIYQNVGNTHTNREVGPFTREGGIYTRDILPATTSPPSWSYQIYPGDPQRTTFFNLAVGSSLWLFNDSSCLLGSARTNDEYIYFCPDQETKKVYLVEAPTKEEALEKIKQANL